MITMARIFESQRNIHYVHLDTCAFISNYVISGNLASSIPRPSVYNLAHLTKSSTTESCLLTNKNPSHTRQAKQFLITEKRQCCRSKTPHPQRRDLIQLILTPPTPQKKCHRLSQPRRRMIHLVLERSSCALMVRKISSTPTTPTSFISCRSSRRRIGTSRWSTTRFATDKHLFDLLTPLRLDWIRNVLIPDIYRPDFPGRFYG